MGGKLVSVNMIAFNVARYIEDSIKSIVNQTYANWELIIIDDGSSDDTLKIANHYAALDSRIKVFPNNTNEGIVYSRNKALHYSSGEYIAVLDSDDIALPARIETQLGFMEKNSDYGMIGSAFYLIDSENIRIGQGNHFFKPELFPALLLFDNFFLHSSVLMRTSLAKKFLYKPLVRGYSPCEEYHLFVDIAKNNKLCNIPESLVEYREHGMGISKTRMDMIEKYKEEVMLIQLNRLGINPSIEQFNIHKNFKNSFSDISLDEIEKISNWLKYLIDRNDKCNIYDSYLNEYLSTRFFEICKLNAEKGLSIWWIYMKNWAEKNILFHNKNEQFLLNRCLYESVRRIKEMKL